VAGQLVAPLYDGGRRKAVANMQQAQLDAAIASYRKTVIGALSDVVRTVAEITGWSPVGAIPDCDGGVWQPPHSA
jgi:outer membrane protein TolC